MDFIKFIKKGNDNRISNIYGKWIIFQVVGKYNMEEAENNIEGQGGSNKTDAPMLLIDDEADNASINIRHGKDEVSRINGQIRDLLKMFERSCYIGYTATPFANIFIDPDTDHDMVGEDLFPRHFIVSLDPPTNYFAIYIE